MGRENGRCGGTGEPTQDLIDLGHVPMGAHAVSGD